MYLWWGGSAFFIFFKSEHSVIMCKDGKEKELQTVNEIILFRQIKEEGGYKARGKPDEVI